MGLWNSFKEWNRKRLKDKAYRRELGKGRKPCHFARTEDGLCPSWISYSTHAIQRHGVGRCCQHRMMKAKMDYCIIYGTAEGMTATPLVKIQAKEGLREYKQNFPEEYAEVFGENEEIGYSAHID